MSASPWLLRLHAAGTHRRQLVALPYAGSGPNVFRKWIPHLPAHTALYAAQLPGRGMRFGEEPVRSMAAIAAPLADAIAALPPLPTVVFGHSMGALLGFLAGAQLQSRLPSLRHLVLSGAAPPQCRGGRKARHLLSEAEFVEELKAMGGLPDVVLNEPEILQLALPALRADFQAIETMSPDKPSPISTDITAWGGRDDTRDSEEELQQWRDLTRGTFDMEMFPGGHFFIDTESVQVLARLRQVIETAAPLSDFA